MDSEALSAINAMDVMVRMVPIQKSDGNVSNKRSFFVNPGPRGGFSIGQGVELWQGFFQYAFHLLDLLHITQLVNTYRSVRPVLRGMILNVDVTTGIM